MNISNPVSSQVASVSFSFYQPKDIKALSVKHITNPIIFDSLDHPTPNGLYDAALGPVSHQFKCETCSLGFNECPGHFGHIDLSVPVYNPITFKLLYKLLQSTCYYCHHLRTSRTVIAVYKAKFILLHAGLVVEASQLDQYLAMKPGKSSEEDDDISISSTDKFIHKVEKFVKESLKKPACKKSSLVNDNLKKLEREFLSSIPSGPCQNCNGVSPKFRKDADVKIFEQPLPSATKVLMASRSLTFESISGFASNMESETDTYLTPMHVRAHIEKLWEKDAAILDQIYGTNTEKGRKSSPDMFFLSVIAVTPNRFRPLSKMGDMQYEHPQNIHLSAILKANIYIQEIREQEAALADIEHSDPKGYQTKKSELFKRTIESWIRLQQAANYLIDSSKAPLVGGKPAPPGIRQILEKKEGLFRKHMMGKRVNYAARSVISPDPYIETNEIGIPPVFAKKLTYPEPVTAHNIDELKKCVINGPDQWPGATHVQNEDGSLVSLSSFDAQGRTAIASALFKEGVDKNNYVNKKVYRHLRNGDFLLLNRQPTLHKPSIMAHTARVLPGEKTIRMHYANCNTYNADFDGDEMNAHFPQNEIARAEAMLIARTDQQYLVPTDGGVLRGLIQDHVDAGVLMCARDTFFQKEEYMQLIYAGLLPEGNATRLGDGNIEEKLVFGRQGKLVIVPPAVLKPKALWTGKQVITTILSNVLPHDRDLLNLESKSKIPAKRWGPSAPEEQQVKIMDGYLLTGILDKSQFGASAKGLIHAIYEIYGPLYAGKMLSILGRLFTHYLQMVGFTCRMDDLCLTPKGDELRRDLIQQAASLGFQVSTEFVGTADPKNLSLELEKVLRSSDKMAGLDSAMKGKTNKVTSNIISTCIPEELYKPFPHNNMQLMTVSGAKGSAVNVSQISCLLGQQELEGKRVPTMISGKTLPSFLPFDTSARAGGFITGRFLTGIKPQEYYYHCMAGREGLIDTAVKTSRSGYLQRCLIKHLEGLKVHYDQTVRDVDGSVLQFRYGEDALDTVKQTTLTDFEFCALNFHALLKRYDPTSLAAHVDEDSVKQYLKSARKENRTVDPVLSEFNPARHLGAVSDKFAQSMDEYIANDTRLLKTTEKRPGWSNPRISTKKFKALMNIKYMHSLVDPGEAVGLLAAQSIGEPSTQMTLNTFHFAGFGAKNVTLGIPRLREIIMTASSSIKTPLMKLPLQPHVTNTQAEELSNKISKLELSKIMEKVTVTEEMVKGATRQKIVTIQLEFQPVSEYKKYLSSAELSQILESKFIPLLERSIQKQIKSSSRKNQTIDDADIGVALGSFDNQPTTTRKEVERDESDDEDVNSDVGDGDATDAKQTEKRTQLASYEEPDEDDEKVLEQMDVDEDDEKEAPVTEQEQRIINDNRFTSKFKFSNKKCDVTLSFPASMKKILMLALVEDVCSKVVIREVKGIDRCYMLDNEAENDSTINLGTDGVNFSGLWQYDELIDMANIDTNDIAAMLQTYGVEAARAAIMKEIASVFGVYGIQVDNRHLSIIADYMTFEGGYKPFNRIGMNSNPSPFAQMSFETTTNFLTAATLTGDHDSLDSPSARLVMGQVVKAGTGSFSILQTIN